MQHLKGLSSETTQLAPAGGGPGVQGTFETQVGTEDLVRLAVEAADLGTWNWHIPSGRVQWTPQTYELFGHRPGSLVVSQDLFLKQVHTADRPSVLAWISKAIRERGRTAFEFRIDRPDGSVRRVRSTGRALTDEQGHVVRMIGVIEDVTDDERRHASAPILAGPPDARAARDFSFSARQVAHILGVAQVTLKRLAAAGEIRSLRSTRKNSQRFTPGDVIDHLRRGLQGQIDFAAAASDRDIAACVVYLLEQVIAGTPLAALLDDRVRPAARIAPAPFMAEVLSRIPFMVPEPSRNAFPALLVEVGVPEHLESEVIACLLRASGQEVLRPAMAPDVAELADVAERVRSRLVVIVLGEGPPAQRERGIAAAGVIARARSSTTTVCLHADGQVHAPRGVTRFHSMHEFSRILQAIRPAR